MKRYFKVVAAGEAEMAGAGLGYEEIYGSKPRFFWDRREANARRVELNREDMGDAGQPFTVKDGMVYDDGSWDDEDDSYAREQLGLVEVGGLREMWDACDGPVFLVLDENGDNIADAKLRQLDAARWLYVDEQDGFRLLGEEDAKSLLANSEEVGA